MKKMKYIVCSVLLVTFLLQGCSSFLDVDIPDTQVKDDFWKTRDQAKAALMSIYTKLGDNTTRFLEWGDLRSDIYGRTSNMNADERQFLDQLITTSNGLANWADVYTGINWANSFIANADRVPAYDQSVTPEEIASMKAEAYALRALFYFYLVRTFQHVPVILEPYESDTQSPYGPAIAEEKVLDIIEADLKIALQDAPERFTDPAEHYGRITKNAVRALWADVKLWRGGEQNYKECITLCEELEKEYDQKMILPEIWFTLFSPGNSPESIFEYQYMMDKGPASPLRTLFYGIGRLDLNYSALQKNMKKAYFSSTLGISDTTRYKRAFLYGSEVFKYTGISFESNGVIQSRDDASGKRVHFIYYRYREVLLIKAEALAMLGQFEEAVKPINRIREASAIEQLSPGEYGKEKIFFDKLLAERVAELGFEGKQWFSLVRVARHTGYDDLLINRIVETSQSGIKPQNLRARLLEKEGWFMPYYENEVNNNLDLVQKIYYKGKK